MSGKLLVDGQLPQTVLALHAEEVARAGQRLVQHAHNRSEHLRRYVLIDMRVLRVVELLTLAEDVVSEADNFILVTLALKKAQLSAIIEAFFD